MKSNAFLLLICFLTVNCFGQRAYVKIQRLLYENGFEDFDSFQFIFNGKRIKATDTTTNTIQLKKTFDECYAIIGLDTQKFICRFKDQQTYTIQPGCCCAAFTLKAIENPKRGTITFKNKSKNDLGLVVAEANIDTVKTKTTKTLFAGESAMCLFKPCSILVVEPAYLSNDFNYEIDNRNYDSLNAKRYQMILSMAYYHFLHGEKIEINYHPHSHKITFKLLGYLSDEAYRKVF